MSHEVMLAIIPAFFVLVSELYGRFENIDKTTQLQKTRHTLYPLNTYNKAAI